MRGTYDFLSRRPSYDHIRGGDIGLNLRIGMAHDVCQKFCRLGAHVPDIDVHHRQRRFDNLGKGEIVKGHNADILRNAKPLLCDRVHTAKGDVIVGADDGVRQFFLTQKIFHHAEAIRPGGFPEPDVLVFQLCPGVGQPLLHTLQPESGTKIVGFSADKGKPFIPPRQKEACGDRAGIRVAV